MKCQSDIKYFKKQNYKLNYKNVKNNIRFAKISGIIIFFLHFYEGERVHFKMSPVSEDTNRGAVCSGGVSFAHDRVTIRHFEMRPLLGTLSFSLLHADFKGTTP
jgi:hypothetical protein